MKGIRDSDKVTIGACDDCNCDDSFDDENGVRVVVKGCDDEKGRAMWRKPNRGFETLTFDCL